MCGLIVGFILAFFGGVLFIVPQNAEVEAPPAVQQTACSYQFATVNDEPLTATVQADFDDAFSAGVITVQATQFGENAVCGDSISFIAMETDFDLTITIEPTDGNILQILEVLVSYPNNITPGPQDSRITLIFTSGERLQFRYTQLVDVLNNTATVDSLK